MSALSSGGFAFLNMSNTTTVNATPLMMIDRTGNVGIGTTNPTAKLDVISVGTTWLRVKNSSTGDATSVWPSFLSINAASSGTYDGISIQDAGQQWNLEKQPSG